MAAPKAPRGRTSRTRTQETGAGSGRTRGRKTPTAASLGDPDDLVRVHAHRIWESEGCPDGKAEAHWLAAKRELGLSEVASSDMGADQGAPGDPDEPGGAPQR